MSPSDNPPIERMPTANRPSCSDTAGLMTMIIILLGETVLYNPAPTISLMRVIWTKNRTRMRGGKAEKVSSTYKDERDTMRIKGRNLGTISAR